MTLRKRIRVVILYANTGGGHRSAAQAIEQGLRRVCAEDCDVSLVNAFSKLRFPWDTVERDYPYWVNYGRMLYSVSFKSTNGRRRVLALRRMGELITDPMAEAIVREHPADVYISCHPVYNHYVPRKAHELGVPAKYVNVVTDLVTGHLFHYAAEVDLCIVPTAEAADIAIENGMPPAKVAVIGQPVWPDFQHRMGNRAETLKSLGLAADLPVVLMMGGGEGMGRIGITAREIAFSDLPVQFVIVCGRNTNLMTDLEFINPRVPAMRVLGFVSNVPELMGAADVLVTKAGPSTICEGFIAGLPILLYDAIPGQEEGNVEYVVRHGAGAYIPNPFAVPKQIRNWLSSPDDMRRMQTASHGLARPNSALDIARAAIATLHAPALV